MMVTEVCRHTGLIVNIYANREALSKVAADLNENLGDINKAVAAGSTYWAKHSWFRRYRSGDHERLVDQTRRQKAEDLFQYITNGNKSMSMEEWLRSGHEI